MKNKIFNYTGILGAILFIVTTIIGGYIFEGFSHISQYISESYAFDTEYGHLLRWFGYIPSGLFIGIFCFFNAKLFKKHKSISYGLIGFGIFYGLFTALVSVFPCDYGCNRDYTESSISQLLHSLLSVLTYFITPLSLYFIGYGLKNIKNLKNLSKVTIILSFTGFIFGVIFLWNANSPVTGLLQRLTESVYLFWIIFFSIKLNKTSPTT